MNEKSSRCRSRQKVVQDTVSKQILSTFRNRLFRCWFPIDWYSTKIQMAFVHLKLDLKKYLEALTKRRILSIFISSIGKVTTT